MLQKNLNSSLCRCIDESKRAEFQEDLESALDYKLKEINILKIISRTANNLFRKIETARSCMTASRYAFNLGKKEENKLYLLKANAGLWKVFNQSLLTNFRLRRRDLKEFFTICGLIKKNYPIKHSVHKEILYRENIAQKYLKKSIR